VNGQKQIDKFKIEHRHNQSDIDVKQGSYIAIDKQYDDGIFKTGSFIAPVHDYWRYNILKH